MVGKKIKDLRTKNNITLKKLGEMLCLGESTISMYENNKRNPDYGTLLRIAEIFDVSIDYLLGRTEVKYPINELPNDFDAAYFRTMQNAKKEGISPDDIDLMIDFIKKAKLRDGE